MLKTRKKERSAAAEHMATKWEVPTLAEWLDKTAERKRWIVPGFAPADGIILFSGPRKLAMKTYTAFTMCMSLASGKHIVPFKPEKPGKVLVIEEEGGTAQTKDRWNAIFAAHPVVDRKVVVQNIHFAFRNLVKLNNIEWREKLVAKVKELKPDLVVFDALAYVIDGDENKTVDVLDALATIQEIRACGCAVMLLHHLNNDKGYDPKADIDSQVRGAGPIKDLYDVHVALRRYKDTEPIKVTVRQRDGETRHDVFTWEFESNEEGTTTLARLLVAEPARPVDPKKAELYRRLHEALEPGAVSTIEQLAKHWNMDKAMASLHAAQMHDAKYFTKTPGGNFKARGEIARTRMRRKRKESDE